MMMSIVLSLCVSLLSQSHQIRVWHRKEAAATLTNQQCPSFSPSPPPVPLFVPQFLFVSTTGGPGTARISHPRVAVVAQKRSVGRVVQTYVDIGTYLSTYLPTYPAFLMQSTVVQAGPIACS